MAKLKGIIKLKGTIGDMTFYKTRNGYVVREKTTVDANRIANDPAYQRTRENSAEFGRAAKAGLCFRTAFKSLLADISDPQMSNRLTREMVKVVQSDSTNARGLRNVIDGEAELLIGFEFNDRCRLSNSFYAPYTTAIDRATGEIKLDVLPFNPSTMLSAPIGTTHFKVISAGVEINFESNTYVVENSESSLLPYTDAETVALSQVNTVTAASTSPLFQAVGIVFYQEVNGTMYPLKNGSYNSLSLVNVNGF